MPSPPAKALPYPVIEDVLNLVRVLLCDTYAGATGTPGEGRVFIDTAPFILPLLNDSMAQLQRDLEIRSVPRPILTTILTGIPPINSASGAGVGNPAAFQNLSYGGFFDGLLNYSTPALPPDLLVPKSLEQRPTGTGLPFTGIGASSDGIPSRFQDFSLGAWEYADDRISWCGSLVPMDIRLRYTSSTRYFINLPPSEFTSVQLPWRDCVQALANRIAWMFASARLPGQPNAQFQADYKTSMQDMTQRYVRYLQSAPVSREPFGDSGDLFGFFS